MKLMELENKAKLDMLERQVELEKVKVHAAEIGKDVSVKHLSKGPKLPHFEDNKDDMDAYLNRFERFAESAGWPQKDWAVSLSALLKGKSLEVYSRLSIAEANDYKKVKTALLKRFALTQEGFRQKFRSCLPESGESAPQFAVRIESYLIRWLEMAGADKSFYSLKDLLLREQFINASQTDLALFLKERKPGNISEMAELAEQYLEAHGNVFMAQDKLATLEKKPDKLDTVKHEIRSKSYGEGAKSLTAGGKQIRTCYFCKKRGHVLRDCFERQRQLKRQGGKHVAGLMNCVADQIEVKVGEDQGDVLEANACYSDGKSDHECCIHDNKVRLECGHELPVINGLCKNGMGKSMPVVQGVLNGKLVTVLRDTGCSSAVVRQELVKDEQLTGRIQRCILIDGTVRSAPVAEILVDSPHFKGRIEALCMSKPIYDLILGNIPGVREPNNPDVNWDMGNLVKVRSKLDNKEVCWRQEITISTAHDKTVTKDDNDIILNEPSDTLPEKVILELSKQIETDVLEKRQGAQTRAQKLKDGNTFEKLKVMKEQQVHRDNFKGLQDKGETLKWVREKSKSEKKKTRKDMVYVSWICIVVCIVCFYQNFKPQFTEKALALTNLTEKGNTNKLVMKLEHQRAFERLKGCMVSTPTLTSSGMNTGFTLKTDTSNVEIGVVLMQEIDEIKFLESYTSDKLLTRETRYSVIDKEYLAHVCEIKKLILYLNGGKFQLETDGRVMRWVLNIQSCPFRFTAIKESQSFGADNMRRTEK